MPKAPPPALWRTRTSTAHVKKLKCTTCGGKHSVIASAPDALPCHTKGCEGRMRLRNGLGLNKVQCRACKHDDEHIIDHSLEEDMRAPRTCEACGAEAAFIMVHAVGLNDFSDRSSRFPYYDRGLGCMLRSKEHRREVMAQQGVVEAAGGMDQTVDEHFRKAKQEDRELDEWGAEYDAKLENDPAFADFRRARDAGALPSLDDLEQNAADLTA